MSNIVIKLFSLSFGRGYWPIADEKGIRLYRVNFMPWDCAESAIETSFLGLPHLRIRLKKALPPFFMRTWSIPLYFWSVENFIQDVLVNAPSDSPVRQCIAGSTQRSWTRASTITTVVAALIFLVFLLAAGLLLLSIILVVKVFVH